MILPWSADPNIFSYRYMWKSPNSLAPKRLRGILQNNQQTWPTGVWSLDQWYPPSVPDMGRSRLRLHEAGFLRVKASASASASYIFGSLASASASASWFSKASASALWFTKASTLQLIFFVFGSLQIAWLRLRLRLRNHGFGFGFGF